jgi:UDP-3-O-[3-hydroxymyristoyl] glucosamine N-acyltransferase
MTLYVRDIIDKLPVTRHLGDISKKVSQVVTLKEGPISDESILWVSDKNMDSLKHIRQGTVICSSNVNPVDLEGSCTYLIVPKPRLYFLNLVKLFFVEKEPPFISAAAHIHSSARIGRNVTIHPGVVIEKDCRVGDDATIDCNTVLKKGTWIGDRVTIGCNNTIGGMGFGYEKNEEGNFEFIPHIGNVIIEDDVEIGNNTTIDRAVLGSTIIRKNAKVDNLVHIAHGVDIGENSLIIANAMIAGSTVIGKNVWVAPSASVLNKLTVGDGATVGMGAVVLKNVEPSQTVIGNPARDITTLKKNP